MSKTLQISVPADVEAALAAEARERGLSEEELVRTLVRQRYAIGRNAEMGSEADRAGDWVDFARRMSDGISEPSLPDEAFRRSSFYEGDDDSGRQA